MKIAVIGGGSSYTPELLDGLLARAADLDLQEVVLHDVDPNRLALVTGFVQRMAKARKKALAISSTRKLGAAVRGAAYVIAQIRVGGNRARMEDEKLGLRHGLIGQETTGVGGFAKALRTIPAMLEIAEVIASESPMAVLINFTNPSGLVTEALLNHSQVQAIGLCNIPVTFHLELAKALGARRDEVELDYVGLNHLAWVRGVRLRGQEVIEEVLAWAGSADQPATLATLDYPKNFLRALHMIPMPYLRYYYRTEKMLAELRARPKTRAEEVREIETELMKIYADPSACEKPDLLSRRGGAHYSLAALELIEAIHFNRGERQVLNVKNQGVLPALAEAAVIEVPCRVTKDGAKPLPLLPPEPIILGLIQTVKAYEELTIQAAVEKNYDQALLALVAHPLGPEVDQAETVLDDIITTHGIKLEKN